MIKTRRSGFSQVTEQGTKTETAKETEKKRANLKKERKHLKMGKRGKKFKKKKEKCRSGLKQKEE